MTKKNIITGLIAITMITLPAVSFASTYQFIDTSGNLQSVEAGSFSVALATAYQLGIHSGVVLVSNSGTGGFVAPTNYPSSNSGSGNYYQFIDTSGNLQTVEADNSSMALATAYQLGIHSGVVLVR